MTNHNQAIVDISQTANKFQSSIVLQYENKYIDVKSILGLYTSIVSNHAFDLHVHGQDEEEARQAMKEVFEKHNLPVNLITE